MTIGELVESFDLQRVNRANAVFDPAKLEWMNKQYLSSLPAEELFPEARKVLAAAGLFDPEFETSKRSYCLSVIDLIKSRITSLNDFAGYGRPFFTDDFEYEEEALNRQLGARGQNPPVETMKGLTRFRDACADPGNDFTLEKTEELLRGIAAETGLKAGVLIGAVRLAVTGRLNAPGIFDVLVTLGRERTVERLNRLLETARTVG
jgi:glutamyl-tRNA synthetase